VNADQIAAKMMEDSKKIAAEDELLAEEEELETAQMSLDDLALGRDIAQAGDILEGESVDFAMNDLASDDEILAAENELFKDEVTEV
jgi:segregation and condensation protein A